MKVIVMLLSTCVAIAMSSCNGMFDGIYDEPVNNGASDEGFFTSSPQINRFSLKIDASDFEIWNYVSLKNKTVEKHSIPLACEGEWDGRSGITYNQVNGDHFQVLSMMHTDAQAEAQEWDFAIHRFDVRTNNGEACRASVNDLAKIEANGIKDVHFTSDVWSTTQVMVDLTNMMAYRIGYQNSYINPVLSEWVKMDISTPPPTFQATGGVYILKLSDGTVAAMQMRSYMNEKGEKGHLTIDIIYPVL